MQRIRKTYLDFFNGAFAKYRAEKGESTASEITVLTGKPNEHDDFFRTYVFDAISRNPDGSIHIVEFNVDPEAGRYDRVKVSSRLCWNAIEFRCIANEFSIARLIEWGRGWMDDAHPKQGPQDGFTGIIHSVTFPETSNDIATFSVDFGSAPIAALDELVQLLGERVIEIGSFPMSEQG